MAKRKHRFGYHGKCAECRGPIMDWRDHLYIEGGNGRVPNVGGWMALTTEYCGGCRYIDSVRRLSAPMGFRKRYFTDQTAKLVKAAAKFGTTMQDFGVRVGIQVAKNRNG